MPRTFLKRILKTIATVSAASSILASHARAQQTAVKPDTPKPAAPNPGQIKSDLPPVVQPPPPGTRPAPDPGPAVPIDVRTTNGLLKRIQNPNTLVPPRTSPAANPASRQIALGEAIHLAVTNSNALRLAAEAVNRARGHVNEARAGYMPAAVVSANITRLDEGASVTFPDANGQPQNINIVNQNQKQVTVLANLPIDIAGLIGAAVQQEQFHEIAARLDYNRVRDLVVLDTKNAYFDVLRAKAFVEVADQAVKNSLDRKTTAEANLKAGTGTRFDVLSSATDVANAEQSLISARNSVNLAIAALNNVLGLDQGTPLETVETQEETTAADTDFPRLVSEAYSSRPELLQSDANIRAAEKGVQLAQRSVLPTLGLGFNFQYQPDASGFAPKTTNYSTVATISMPVFDGGLARARTQQAKADVNTARVNKRITQDNIALDVRQQYLSLVEAQDRLNVTTAAVLQGQEQFRLAQVRFKAGVTAIPGGSPLLEVSDAQNALTLVQINHVRAQYDLQNSKARLDHAVGRYSYDPAGSVGLPAPNTGGK